MAKSGTMARRGLLADLLAGSAAVLTGPTTASLEAEEGRGGLAQASLYMVVASVVAGLIYFPLGLGAMVRGGLLALIGYFVFTGLIYSSGQSAANRAPFGAVAYVFALFIAPLSLLLPIVTFVLLHPAVGLSAEVIPTVLAVVALVVLALQATVAAFVLKRPALSLVDAQSLAGVLFVAVAATWFVQMLVALLRAPWA